MGVWVGGVLVSGFFEGFFFPLHLSKSPKSYDYITYDRTDLYKGGKHVITENWGKYFLVAIQKDKSGDEKVLGTVSYKERKKGEVQVGIENHSIHLVVLP